MLVVNEDRKCVNGLLVVHLPAGPSVHFKLSKLVLGADIPVCPAAEHSAIGMCVHGARCSTCVCENSTIILCAGLAVSVMTVVPTA